MLPCVLELLSFLFPFIVPHTCNFHVSKYTAKRTASSYSLLGNRTSLTGHSVDASL